jgi:hypothetical protein
MENPLNKVFANAPPPPPLEVKIRTMRSDIESMMKSGGGAPSFQNVAVLGLSMEKEYKAQTPVRTPMPVSMKYTSPVVSTSASKPVAVSPAAPDLSPPPASSGIPSREFTPDAGPDQSQGQGSSIVPIVIVVIIAILAIAVVGYFAYTVFAK